LFNYTGLPIEMPFEDVSLGINLFGRQPLGKHIKSQRGRLENDGMLVIKCSLRK
jgi:hypothetical protein